jgi:hypothetical protein
MTPNNTAATISMVFKIPSVAKDSFINIVEMIKPELRMTLLNLSERKNENKSKSTSIKIRIVKKSAKKILLMSLILSTISVSEKKFS